MSTLLGSPPLFVTGGVGGVHRGAEDTMDVSADLVEMGRARTAVLSAGVKSILDIGRTLEYLVRESWPRSLNFQSLHDSFLKGVTT